MQTILVDFNTMQIFADDAHVILAQIDNPRDQGIHLCEDERVIVYDDEIHVEAIAHREQNYWVGKIDWSTKKNGEIAHCMGCETASPVHIPYTYGILSVRMMKMRCAMRSMETETAEKQRRAAIQEGLTQVRLEGMEPHPLFFTLAERFIHGEITINEALEDLTRALQAQP